jgi:hypothetical protein
VPHLPTLLQGAGNASSGPDLRAPLVRRADVELDLCIVSCKHRNSGRLPLPLRLVDPNLRSRAPHTPQTWPQECPSALTPSIGGLAGSALVKQECREREMTTGTGLGLVLKRPRHMLRKPDLRT